MSPARRLVTLDPREKCKRLKCLTQAHVIREQDSRPTLFPAFAQPIKTLQLMLFGYCVVDVVDRKAERHKISAFDQLRYVVNFLKILLYLKDVLVTLCALGMLIWELVRFDRGATRLQLIQHFSYFGCWEQILFKFDIIGVFQLCFLAENIQFLDFVRCRFEFYWPDLDGEIFRKPLIGISRDPWKFWLLPETKALDPVRILLGLDKQ